jgi:small subunit ribosomal protein S19e
MVNFKDVPPETLLKKLSSELAKSIKEPDWVDDVKTGEHKERGPIDDDWYYMRLASVLRKIAINGPIGIEKLAAEYGGKVDRGSKRHHAAKGSRKILREALSELEAKGYVKKDKKGRSLTPEGMKILNAVSLEVINELKEKVPSIAKYA